MTRDEVKRLMMLIQVNYQMWNPADKQALLDMWCMIFADDDAKVIELGLMNYIKNDTSGFAPSPGQIRARIKDVVKPLDETEDEIAQLRTAVSKSIYYSVREFEELSPTMQKAVGRPENLRAWAMQPTEQFEAVTLSHVRKAYRNIKEQEERLNSLKPLRESDINVLGSASERPQIGG